MISGWIGVAPNGDDRQAASAPHDTVSDALARPLGSVQTAVGRAGPGVAILLREGVYRENVLISGAAGRIDNDGPALRRLKGEAPLVLLGIDGMDGNGRPRARLVGARPESTLFVTSLGHVRVANIEVAGVEGMGVDGDHAPVKFIGGPGNQPLTQAATDFTLEGCRIVGGGRDGLKVGRARRVTVAGCVFDATLRESMIDFVTVRDSVVRDCAFRGVAMSGATAKGASGRLLWRGNDFDYSAQCCAQPGWADPPIMIGGIGHSRAERRIEPDYWNVECFDSLACENLLAGDVEYAAVVWGGHDNRIERNYVAHRGAPDRMGWPLYAWKCLRSPSSPWRNQWLPHAGGGEDAWRNVSEDARRQLRALGAAVSLRNVFAANRLDPEGGHARGFAKNDPPDAQSNRIEDETYGSLEAWRAEVGGIGPIRHNQTAIHDELGLGR